MQHHRKRQRVVDSHAGSKRPKLHAGLSLDDFAEAKKSGYDKKHRKEKEFALNAKKVNRYKKLKQKLARQGRLQPSTVPQSVEEDEHPAERGHSASDTARARARAGPPPDDSDVSSSDAEEPQQQHDQDQSTASIQVHDHLHKPWAVNAGNRDSRTTHHKHIQQDELPGPPGLSGEPAVHNADAATLSTKHSKYRRQKPPSRLLRVAEASEAKKKAEAEARAAKQRDIEERQAKAAQAQQHRKQQTNALRKKTRTGQPVMKYRINQLLDKLQHEVAS
jgi:hypothetical protein